MPRAFTRAVSPRLAQCELTHLDRRPIDAQRAAAQHHCYERALAGAGYDIIRLPDLPLAPDGVFVEDTALILGAHAIITRPGARSRAGETRSTAEGLAPHFELHWIENGFLDGGDVLKIGDRLYVGLSTRTDAAGVAALSDLVRPLGFTVVSAKLGSCLHLKTGASLAGMDGSGRPVLLYRPEAIDPTQFAQVEPLPVNPGEAAAANCVRVADKLVVPAENPRTADQLKSRGFDLIEIDVSELQKAEAGLTCMSLIDDRA